MATATDHMTAVPGFAAHVDWHSERQQAILQVSVIWQGSMAISMINMIELCHCK